MTTAPRLLPWLLGAMASLTIATLVGTALAPTLLTYHPLVLILLSPLDRHMVLAASVTPLAPFLLVSAGRRMLTCMLGYGFGYAYGDEGIAFLRARYPRGATLAELLQRWARRVPPAILLLAPWSLFCGAAAGAAGMRFWLFLLLATTGQLIWARLAYRVSAALDTWIQPIVVFMRDHVVSATLVCVLLVAIYVLVRRRERRSTELAAQSAALPQPDASREA